MGASGRVTWRRIFQLKSKGKLFWIDSSWNAFPVALGALYCNVSTYFGMCLKMMMRINHANNKMITSIGFTCVLVIVLSVYIRFQDEPPCKIFGTLTLQSVSWSCFRHDNRCYTAHRTTICEAFSASCCVGWMLNTVIQHERFAETA